MAANNTILVIGRVGRDPETRTINTGRAVTKFSLAVNRPVKDKQGNAITDWFNVELWGKQADLAGELVRKGALISVAGACQIDEYTDRDGNKQRAVKINADGFQLLGGRDDQERQGGDRTPRTQAQGFGYDDDDIPPF